MNCVNFELSPEHMKKLEKHCRLHRTYTPAFGGGVAAGSRSLQEASVRLRRTAIVRQTISPALLYGARLGHLIFPVLFIDPLHTLNGQARELRQKLVEPLLPAKKGEQAHG